MSHIVINFLHCGIVASRFEILIAKKISLFVIFLLTTISHNEILLVSKGSDQRDSRRI